MNIKYQYYLDIINKYQLKHILYSKTSFELLTIYVTNQEKKMVKENRLEKFFMHFILMFLIFESPILETSVEKQKDLQTDLLNQKIFLYDKKIINKLLNTIILENSNKIKKTVTKNNIYLTISLNHIITQYNLGNLFSDYIYENYFLTFKLKIEKKNNISHENFYSLWLCKN